MSRALLLPVLGLVVAACSANVPAGFTSACEGDALLLAKGFAPTNAVDFVGERVETLRQDETTFQYRVESRAFSADQKGTPCGGATDRAACNAKLDALPSATSCSSNGLGTRVAAPPSGKTCSATYYVFTRGDEVGVVSNVGEARAFFGTIDAPEEALALARFNGEVLACTDALAAYAKVADGYEVASEGPCGHRVIAVTGEGKMSISRDDCKEDP